MAQNCNREYWQELINKYGERTGELLHKQQELFIKTETLKTMIGGNCNNAEKLLLSTPPPTTTTHDDDDDDMSIIHTRDNLSSNSTVGPLQEYKLETNNKFDIDSLKSEDLQLIQKLERLLVEQKTLNKQINELERKERAYKEFLNEQPINYENKQQLLNCKCLDKNTINDNNNNSSNNNKQLCELKLENLLLKNELKDLKLEIRQYLERIEGPMEFKIESERYKCVKLEEQLEQERKEFDEQQQLCKNEINTLNIELMNTNTNLDELKKANEELLLIKPQLEMKIKQLEDDLIRQKLSGFETIKSLTEELQKSNKTTLTEQKESYNLNEIAKKLSGSLKEIGECSCSLSDIKATVENIEELAMS